MEGIDPDTQIKDSDVEKSQPMDVASTVEDQTRLCFEKIKEAIEEAGSSLDNIVKMWYYVVGDFPDGLAYSGTWQTICRVREAFLKEHAPEKCVENNPPTLDLLGVKHLALPDMVIEIAVQAVI
ncbi:MAG: RidA family protein [Deltaproteobacteria bacterium]|nr:RidA family protein [Deltaproteobacteria bacterium]